MITSLVNITHPKKKSLSLVVIRFVGSLTWFKWLYTYNNRGHTILTLFFVTILTTMVWLVGASSLWPKISTDVSWLPIYVCVCAHRICFFASKKWIFVVCGVCCSCSCVLFCGRFFFLLLLSSDSYVTIPCGEFPFLFLWKSFGPRKAWGADAEI
jgi:hypothetical protein